MISSAIKLKPKEGETYFDVVAVVDPVTREAQRLAPLLLVGTTAEAVHVIHVTSYYRKWSHALRFSGSVTVPSVILKRHWKMLWGILGRASVFKKMGYGSENNFITLESGYKFGWLPHVIKEKNYL